MTCSSLDSCDSLPIYSLSRPKLSIRSRSNPCLNFKKSTVPECPASDSFCDNYTLSDKLGDGSSCTVYKCIRKRDHKLFAVKIIQKNELTQKQETNLRKECVILSRLMKCKNKNVTKFYESYETKKRFYLILELCYGGNLFNYVISKCVPTKDEYELNEKEVAKLFFQIVHGLNSCHKAGVVHRDLKPENIMFKHPIASVDKPLKLKITDFGLSFLCTSKNKGLMKARCGSPNYLAPEILLNKTYTFKVDYWSCGVILYTLLTGLYPFHSPNTKELYRQIVNMQYDFSSDRWKNVSGEAIDLIRNLLVKDPKERYGYNEIVGHPWLKNNLY